jgi:hypothetical protein
VAFSLGNLDWGHVVLLALLIASLAAHFRTSRRRRFSMTFTLKRDNTNDISSEKNVTQQQHDSDEGDEIIRP